MYKTKKRFLIFILLGVLLILAIFQFKNMFINKSKTENTIVENAETIIDDSSTNFKVKDVKALKGEEIAVEIELLNDSNFVAANFEYKYDIDNLEYIDYEIGDSLKDGAMTIVNNDENNKKVLIGYVANPEEDNKIIKSGKLIEIRFIVKDKLTNNKIENIFECTTLKEEDGTDISYNIQQGLIEAE